jgi:MFS family permease
MTSWRTVTTDRPAGRARWLPPVALAALPAALIPLTARVWAGRLPDPLPSHWDHAGRVDDTTSVGATVTTLLVVAAVPLAAALVATLTPSLRWRVRRAVIGVAGAVTAGAAALWLMTVALSAGTATAADVPGPSWHIMVLLLGPAAWGALVARACGTPPAEPASTDPPPAGLARLDLAPGQRAAWTEAPPTPRAVWVALVPLLVTAVALAIGVNAWVAGAPLIAAVVVLVFMRTRLTVDNRGVTVGFGPWGRPRVRVPMREIVSAAPTTVRVADWGGWGYRYSLDTRGRGLILRSGPGVRLELSSDRYFVATVRDPATVSALVNSLLDTARTS